MSVTRQVIFTKNINAQYIFGPIDDYSNLKSDVKA